MLQNFMVLMDVQSSQVHINIWHQAPEYFSLCYNPDSWTSAAAVQNDFVEALQGLATLAGL